MKHDSRPTEECFYVQLAVTTKRLQGPVNNALSRSHNVSLLPTSWAETSILESGDNYDPNTDPPVLVVGTKLDLLPGNRQPQHKQVQLTNVCLLKSRT